METTYTFSAVEGSPRWPCRNSRRTGRILKCLDGARPIGHATARDPRSSESLLCCQAVPTPQDGSVGKRCPTCGALYHAPTEHQMTHTVNSNDPLRTRRLVRAHRRQTGRIIGLRLPWWLVGRFRGPYRPRRRLIVDGQDDSRLLGESPRFQPEPAAEWFRYIHRPSGVLCIAGCDSGWCSSLVLLTTPLPLPRSAEHVAPRGYTDVAPSSTCDGWSGRRATTGDASGSKRNPNTQRNRHGLIRSAEIYRSRPAMGLSHGRMQETAVGVDYCDKEA